MLWRLWDCSPPSLDNPECVHSAWLFQIKYGTERPRDTLDWEVEHTLMCFSSGFSATSALPLLPNIHICIHSPLTSMQHGNPI